MSDKAPNPEVTRRTSEFFTALDLAGYVLRGKTEIDEIAEQLQVTADLMDALHVALSRSPKTKEQADRAKERADALRKLHRKVARNG